MKPSPLVLRRLLGLAVLALLAVVLSTSPPPVLVVLLLVLGAVVAWVLLALRGRELEAGARFRIYFERAMVGMAVSSPEKCWQVVNPALCEILGYPAAELVGKNWAELTHPDDLAANNELFEQTLSGEINTYELEKRFIRADGRVINTLLSAQAVRKPNGSVDSILVVIEDITARVAAEKALRASEERLRHLGDNLPDSYVYQCAKYPDGDLRFLYVSSGVRLVHGFEPEDLLNDPGLLSHYVDPAQLPELHAKEAESLRTLSDFSIE